ncbi:flagellar basal body L-ring protein FlgH [Sphingomonas sp. AP4-R1]|uniref:flagellar basal body L-ring protein FlgH n=1 Tax=Sphingomonas sp. AP4-R1 TaxID=2735134 RepID=UPI00149337A0|nr:flagellar basal body L-ring protein FlgH [Sphingomonas sp. AP4-R1]QJU57441.1 flagellar basal body L-ring protein FlgH [Sphingomonas sp. AP4-R1]
MTARTLPALLAITALSATLGGCGAVGRLSAVGKAPKMTASEPATSPMVQPSLGEKSSAGRYAMGAAPPVTPGGTSLFRIGAGAFLHDQRAASVGDILTVRINIADNAVLDNSSTRSRSGAEKMGIPGLFGLESKIPKILPGTPDPAKLVDANSNSNSTGAGNTSRSEQINTTVAAIVVDVLPNGNLVIRGRQEVRVNYELREMLISGIVRPQDIARDNSIRNSQIADARISYGGRGQITDMQQPRWGQQVYEAVMPF